MIWFFFSLSYFKGNLLISNNRDVQHGWLGGMTEKFENGVSPPPQKKKTCYKPKKLPLKIIIRQFI